MKTVVLLALLILFGHGIATAAPAIDDPLPSWNEGAVKSSIVSFVEKVTKEGSADFIPPAERIAVFDNDGTLWAEQPIYFQVQFALDRVKALAPQHPEWKDKQPFKALLEGDKKAFAAGGEKYLLEVIAVSHTGMTTDEFQAIVKDWLRTAQPSTIRKALHGMYLSAHARAARLPARERLQDLHCVRWRCGVYARLGREGVRHLARAGRWEHGEAEVRDA